MVRRISELKNNSFTLETRFPPNLSVMHTHATTHYTLAAAWYVLPETFERQGYACESCFCPTWFFYFGSNHLQMQHSYKEVWLSVGKQLVSASTCCVCKRLGYKVSIQLQLKHLCRTKKFLSILSICIFRARDPYTQSYQLPKAFHTISQRPAPCTSEAFIIFFFGGDTLILKIYILIIKWNIFRGDLSRDKQYSV